MCLLCFETSGDLIHLESDEAIKLEIPPIVFKYFCVFFEVQPMDGEICRKCWCRIELFHSFYQRIEEIQSSVVRSEPIIVNTLDINEMKNEELDHFDDIFGSCDDFEIGNFAKCEIIAPLKEADANQHDFEHTFDDYRNLSSDDDGEGAGEMDAPSESKPTLSEIAKTKYKQTSLYDIPQCDICKKTFKRHHTLRGHIYKYHADRKFECNKCGRKLQSQVSLSRHMQIMHDPTRVKKSRAKPKPAFKTFQCEFCSEYFLSEMHLEKHVKHKHVVLPFKCGQAQCVESFATHEKLQRHITKAHERTPCPHCQKPVLNKTLAQHISRMHCKRTETLCELCGKVFAVDYLKRVHMPVEHGKLEKVQCDMCKSWFKDKNNLLKHMKVIHLGAPQTCSICGKISPNIKALRSHILIHEKPKYECIVCGKGFRHSGKLREHSYIHSGKMDAYECNFCGKKFRFSSSWSAHRMKYHPEEMSESIKRMKRIRDNATKIRQNHDQS